MWLTENSSSALAVRERERVRLRRLDDPPRLARSDIVDIGCGFSDQLSSAVQWDAVMFGAPAGYQRLKVTVHKLKSVS